MNPPCHRAWLAHAPRPTPGAILSAGLAAIAWGWAGWGGGSPGAAPAGAQTVSPSAPGVAEATWALPAPRPPFDPAIEPLDVAWDPGGGILVADAANAAVIGYDAAGARRRVWRIGDTAGVPACQAIPIALAVDGGRGHVYVLWRIHPPDGAGGSTETVVLEVRDDGGSVTRQQPVVADDLAVEPGTGNLWLYDAAAGRVVERRLSDSLPLRSIAVGRRPGGAGSLAITPTRVAVVIGRSVELFDRDGRRQPRVDLGGQPAQSVAAGTDGRLWVLVRPGGAFTDALAAPLIHRLDARGDPIDVIQHAALGAAPLPAGIGWPFAIDVQQDAPAFTTGREQAPFEVRWHAGAVGPARVIAGGPTRNGGTAPRCRDGRAGVPPAIVATGDGDLIALDAAGGQIVAIDPAAGGGYASAIAEAPAGARDVAVDDTGAVLVLGADGEVLAFRRDAQVGPAWRLVCGCGRGDRVAIGHRSLFVGQPEPLPGRIQWRSARTGAAIGNVNLPPGTGGRWPADVAAVPGGDALFAAGLVGGMIHVWNIAGGRTTDGPMAAWGAGVAAGPRRLAATRTTDGTLVAALRSDGSVAVFDDAGDLRAAWRPRTANGTPITGDDVAVGPDGRVYLVAGTGRAVHAFAAPGGGDVEAPATTPPPPDPARRACAPVARRIVPAGSVPAGVEIDVGIAIDVACPPGRAAGADVVVALDRSSSMAGAPLAAAVGAARAFVAGLDRGRHRVALVTFGDGATVDAPLSSDPAPVLGKLAALRALGGTDVAAALDVAGGVLAEAAAASDGPARLPVVVLLSDGGHGNPGTDPRAVAAALRARGIARFTIGLGAAADAALLADVADGQYFPAPEPGDLAPIYRAIHDRIASPGIGDVILDERSGADHAIVPRSADPPAWAVDEGLRWGRAVLPRTGLTLTYRIAARQPGRLVLGAGSAAVYADAAGIEHPLAIPTAVVSVSVGVATATATPVGSGTPGGSPTAAGTAPVGTPGPPATVAAMATATASPPGRPALVYLPHVDGCAGAAPPLTAVLVLDASASMLERLPGAPRAKLDGARAALAAWLGAVRWEAGDRIGLVTFHRRAAAAAPLGASRAALETALGTVGVDDQTRLDLGIMAAHAMLAEAPGGGSRRVIVVLTDGRPYPVAGAVVIAAAAAAKADGIRIVAVGLGDELDAGTLRAVASSPADFHRAATDDALVARFRALGGEMACAGR